MITGLNDNRYKVVEKTMKKLGYKRSSLIEILYIAQDTFGYLDKETLRFIAKRLKLPLSKVYGVSTFYNFFRLQPTGKHTAVICLGTACYIKGADNIVKTFEKRFQIKVGETTSDGLISLLTARCVGSCSLAPLAVFDNKTVGHLTKDIINDEIKKLIK